MILSPEARLEQHKRRMLKWDLLALAITALCIASFIHFLPDLLREARAMWAASAP